MSHVFIKKNYKVLVHRHMLPNYTGGSFEARAGKWAHCAVPRLPQGTVSCVLWQVSVNETLPPNHQSTVGTNFDLDCRGRMKWVHSLSSQHVTKKKKKKES